MANFTTDMVTVLESDVNLTVCVNLDTGVMVLDRFVSFEIITENECPFGMIIILLVKLALCM